MTEREIYEKHDNLCDIAEAKKKKRKRKTLMDLEKN